MNVQGQKCLSLLLCVSVRSYLIVSHEFLTILCQQAMTQVCKTVSVSFLLSSLVLVHCFYGYMHSFYFYSAISLY